MSIIFVVFLRNWRAARKNEIEREVGDTVGDRKEGRR